MTRTVEASENLVLDAIREAVRVYFEPFVWVGQLFLYVTALMRRVTARDLRQMRVELATNGLGPSATAVNEAILQELETLERNVAKQSAHYEVAIEMLCNESKQFAVRISDLVAKWERQQHAASLSAGRVELKNLQESTERSISAISAHLWDVHMLSSVCLFGDRLRAWQAQALGPRVRDVTKLYGVFRDDTENIVISEIPKEIFDILVRIENESAAAMDLDEAYEWLRDTPTAERLDKLFTHWRTIRPALPDADDGR